MDKSTIKKMGTGIAARIVFVAIVIAVGTIAGSCNKSKILYESMHSISGLITDSLTNVPVADAKVTWGDTVQDYPKVYSGSDGHYRIGIPDGMNTKVLVSKLGYRTKTKTLNVSKDIDQFNFELAADSL